MELDPGLEHRPPPAGRALPDTPPIAESRLAGPLVGTLDLTKEWRRPTGPALALVGDAALAADPVGAVGCGWAVQSAEWLTQAVSPALHRKHGLPAALRAYRRRHRRELLGHSLMAADAARAALVVARRRAPQPRRAARTAAP